MTDVTLAGAGLKKCLQILFRCFMCRTRVEFDAVNFINTLYLSDAQTRTRVKG